jgi:DsbC/DsbD-like thiol-disulfide interchange protein
MHLFRRTPIPLFHGLAGLLLLALTALGPTPAGAEEVSPWAQGLHSRVRLVAGGSLEGRPLAGVEFALDRGFKTYWRHPGDAGLPPSFDWSASDNVASVEVRWPAPKRVEDAGGVSYVYPEWVILPFVVTPQDPKRPVRLELTLDYGVCKDICIPAHSTLSLSLPAKAERHAGIEAALAGVPKPLALGAPGELAVLSTEALPGDKPRIAVLVRRPAGAKPVIFPEAPDNWFVSAPAEGEEPAADQTRFLLTLEERPKDHPGPLPLRLTLVAGEKAVETDVTVELPKKP